MADPLALDNDRTRAALMDADILGKLDYWRTLLASFLPWLMLNRDGLTILLHPGTGDAYADHTDHAAWLGGILRLRLGIFRKESRA